jgi:hypothetical protein
MALSIPSTRSFFRFLGSVAFLGVTVVSSPAVERQHHGVAFEKWVRDTFFDGYVPADYTQKWDIPAEVNAKHGHLPVNPKVAEFGGPVDLGDALRQFDIDEPFWLVVGYWKSEEGRKRMVTITAIRVEPETWRKLWGQVTRADIEKLAAVIKDRSLSPEEARRLAQEMKARSPFSDSPIVFNPKIDRKSQRRLQCSLRFADVFRLLAPKTDPEPEISPSLWGVPFPGFVE